MIITTPTAARREPGPPLDPPHDPRPIRRNAVARLIQRHPLLSFFVLANVLSWSAWTPYVLSNQGLGLWDVDYPALLGTTQILGVLPGAYLGPLGSAFLITAVADGRSGLRRWARRLWHWRVRWTWYAITLLGVPAGLILAGLVFSGGAVQAPSAMALIAYLPALVIQMLTTGLAEEPGWRDFALPRLQQRFSPFRASLILGPLWAMWHLPLFLTEWGSWPDAHWTRPLVFLVFCVGFNFVMSWVFNSTGQSLPLAMLAHVSVNNFSSVIWSEMFPTLDLGLTLVAQATAAVIAAIAVLAATRGRLGLPPGHGRVPE